MIFYKHGDFVLKEPRYPMERQKWINGEKIFPSKSFDEEKKRKRSKVKRIGRKESIVEEPEVLEVMPDSYSALFSEFDMTEIFNREEDKKE